MKQMFQTLKLSEHIWHYKSFRYEVFQIGNHELFTQTFQFVEKPET